jgi:hypothetical protein
MGIGDNHDRLGFPEVIGWAENKPGKSFLVEFFVEESQSVRFLKPFSQIAQVANGYRATSITQFF